MSIYSYINTAIFLVDNIRVTFFCKASRLSQGIMAPFNTVMIVFLVAYSAGQCRAARILGLFPVPSISHQVVFRALMQELAKRGHEIVLLTTDPAHSKDKRFENITEIDVHDISYEAWNARFVCSDLKDTLRVPRDVLPLFRDEMAHIVDMQLGVPEMKAILENPDEHFDLIFVESILAINFVASARFNAPIIGFNSVSGMLADFDAVGNPSHPVLYPDVFEHNVGELDFWQRLDSVYGNIYQRYMDWTFSEIFNRIARKHFGANSPTVEECQRKMAMLFLNVHPILNGIRPVVPAIVYLGSTHLKPTKPLPKDLKQFLDESTQGVIYMSLGSNVKSKDLSIERINILIETFGELPYNVLWKFENDTLPGQPPNVYLSKWMPQNDLLGHPNIKAFITQGGQQSMEEAVQYKVPLIGIPFLGDQDFNVKRMVHLGIGAGLSINTIDKPSLKATILEIAGNIKYKESITLLSNLLQDRPDTGLERAVWWTEYVIRHGGAGHLRAPSVPLYQYLMLDILAFVASIVLGTVFVAYSILRYILRAMFGATKLKKS